MVSLCPGPEQSLSEKVALMPFGYAHALFLFWTLNSWRNL